jgi:hypothetical protein
MYLSDPLPKTGRGMTSCLCGKSVAHPVSKGRSRKFCSDRCRKRAQRKREAQVTKVCHKIAAIRLYCGIGEVNYNHHPLRCGAYACISPVCGRDDSQHVSESSRRNTVYVPDGVLIIQDSGAFSDGPRHRLSYADALQRQIEHARHYKYTAQVTHRASYDLLIDETWKNEFRQKQRWTEEAGKFAVQATIEAAAYLNKHRSQGIGCIMSAQGVTPEQYLVCSEQVLTYVDREQDIFGLGGFCILGKQPSLLPMFQETIARVIPLVASHHVKRIHIWGVCFAKALGALLWLSDRYGIQVSTDSIGPAPRPTKGEWGYASWRDPSYRKPEILDSCRCVNASGYKAPTCPTDTRCMGLERSRHVALTREWLAHFREREPDVYRSF